MQEARTNYLKGAHMADTTSTRTIANPEQLTQARLELKAIERALSDLIVNETDPYLAVNLGRLSEAVASAETAVFNVLNVASSFLQDAGAEAEIDGWAAAWRAAREARDAASDDVDPREPVYSLLLTADAAGASFCGSWDVACPDGDPIADRLEAAGVGRYQDEHGDVRRAFFFADELDQPLLRSVELETGCYVEAVELDRGDHSRRF